MRIDRCGAPYELLSFIEERRILPIEVAMLQELISYLGHERCCEYVSTVMPALSQLSKDVWEALSL